VSKEKIFFKSFLQFPEEFDFQKLSGFLDRNNFSTRLVSNWKDNYVLESIIQVKWVHKSPEFGPLHADLEKQFNPEKKESNIDMFLSMVSGVSGPAHIDEEESVHLIQLYGSVVYKLEDGMYELEPGDMLRVPSGKLHKAIGLTPRMTLSYGVFGDK
jgi:mannose-6-phosphate isomerase-like protein (cupin superfamily)